MKRRRREEAVKEEGAGILRRSSAASRCATWRGMRGTCDQFAISIDERFSVGLARCSYIQGVGIPIKIVRRELHHWA